MKDCENCLYGDPNTVICTNPKRCVTYDRWEKKNDGIWRPNYDHWNTHLQVEPEPKETE